MPIRDSLPRLAFASQKAWHDWLAEHHRTSEGLWLKIAKKDSKIPSVTYAEALESALCYGWIDGQKQKCDDEFWLQKFTLRKPKSIWSAVNRQKALDLIEAGKMQPPGLAAIEAAKANGLWDNAYSSSSTAIVPEDLLQALAPFPEALAFFEALNRSNRYSILFRLETARKPETRQRKIAEMVERMKNEQLYHPLLTKKKPKSE